MSVLDQARFRPEAGPGAVPGRRARVVCVLSEAERRMFLTGAEARLRELPADIVWMQDTRGLTEDFLREMRPEILLTAWASPALPAAWIAGPDCPLRYVCHLVGSVKQRVPRAFIERGGLVSNWGAQAAGTVAEHALLLALAALRNLGGWRPLIARTQRGGESVLLDTRTLFNRRVGIHGFGGVARALVRLLRPFRVEMRSHSGGVPAKVFLDEGVSVCDSLDELMDWSEVFFECESLTPSNHGAVGARQLARLPDGAVFVNVGRGQIVDEPALLAEAKSGRIRVALDVVCDEPITPANPLCEIDDAVLSPHIAGPTRDQYPRLGEFAAQNLERYLAGVRPEALVTLDIYDRST